MTQSNSRASKEGFATGPIDLPATVGAAMALIENHDFSAPATTFTFSGLDGDADCIYLLQYRIVKAAAAPTLITLRPNGATTNQHSWSRYFGSGSGTYDFAVLDIDRNGDSASGEISSGEVWIYAESGVGRIFRGNEVQFRTGTTFSIDIAGTWSNTAANIASIDVVCDVANGIGTGSFLRLYKLRKE